MSLSACLDKSAKAIRQQKILLQKAKKHEEAAQYEKDKNAALSMLKQSFGDIKDLDGNKKAAAAKIRSVLENLLLDREEIGVQIEQKGGRVTEAPFTADSIAEVKNVSTATRGPWDRDDLVGAIMRATGHRGIAASMALTITGDTANNVTKLRGLFTTDGLQDLDDIALLLRDEEGYSVRDGEHLSELIREQAAGNPVYSNARIEREAAENAEKEYKAHINQRATELGLKKIGGKRTLAVVEAEITKVEQEISQREAEEERAAIQAESVFSEPQELTSEDIVEWLGQTFDYTQEEMDYVEAYQADREDARIAEDAFNDSEGKAQGNTGARPETGETQEGARGTAEGQVTSTSDLPDGTTVVDGNGKQYRVHYQRNHLVIAHPIVDGKAQVSADTTVRFWVDPTRIPSSDNDRTDPIYKASDELSLTGQTNAEASAEYKRQQEEANKKDAEPAAPTVKFDQVDMFNTQGALFNSNRDQATVETSQIVDQAASEKNERNDSRRDSFEVPNGYGIFVDAFTGEEESLSDAQREFLNVSSARERKAVSEGKAVGKFQLFMFDGSLMMAITAPGGSEWKVASLRPDGTVFSNGGKFNHLMSFGFDGQRTPIIKKEEFDRLSKEAKDRRDEAQRVAEEDAKPTWYSYIGSNSMFPRSLIKKGGKWYRIINGKLSAIGRRSGDASLLFSIENSFREWIPSSRVNVDAEGFVVFDNEAEKQPEKSEKIEDFGEKLGGAKKDLWGTYQKSLSDDLPSDNADITLSKHFPEPDYEKLIEAGVDIRVLAAVKAMRDEIPAKPRMKHKLRTWADKVRTLREFASGLLDGSTSIDHVIGLMRQASGLRDFADRISLYAELGYPAFKSANGYSISGGWNTDFDEKGKPRKENVWGVRDDHGRVSFFDTREQALAALQAKLAVAPEKTARSIKLDLYKVTSTGDIVIGKKIASNKYIDLKTGFKSARDAREYLRDNEESLLKLLEEKKKFAPIRRSTNDPRVGKDYRVGENATAEKFAAEFGFRGVEFGNWVEQHRRQQDLNNAYDALLDLSNLLGIPPRAISLNGSLGLAFGARGSGGVDAAKAHYEPDNVVINLTKKDGSGSLGHEWLHALDNYFAKARGEFDGFISQKPYFRGEGVREEVTTAFKNLMDALNKSDYRTRSIKADSKRSKDYWSNKEEMLARAFEAYLITKAEEKGESNDYLANIVDEKAFEVFNQMQNEAFGNDPDPYVYPTSAERKVFNPLFDALFQTLQTKETDSGVAIFSIDDGAVHKDNWLSDSEILSIIEPILQEFGGSDIPVRVLDSLDDLSPVSVGLNVNSVASGVLKNGVIHLFKNGLTDRSAVVRTLFHEMFHFGIRRFMSREQYIEAMQKLYKSDEVIRNAANAWLNTQEAKDLFEKTKDSDYLYARATDEALADTAAILRAENRDGLVVFNNKKTGVLQSIKNWMAWLARKFKFDAVAKALEGVKDVEITPETKEFILSMFDKLKSGAEPSSALRNWAYSDPAFKKTEGANKVTGDMARVNVDVRDAANERLGRMDAQERNRVLSNLEAHKGTAWAAAAVKGLAYREMLERAMEGRDISNLERNDIWGKQDMSVTTILKAFKRYPDLGNRILTQLISYYKFVGGNRKAEQDISTSFANCDPSIACAEHCYAAGSNARPNEIAKSELTEFMMEHFPEETAERIYSEYAISAAGKAGLSLRLNDKGDLSKAQLNVISILNDKGVPLQVFSKRPDLLRSLSDINLKMLSIDGTNMDVARDNPDLGLAVTITDEMTEEMLKPVHDRVSVYFPVNLKNRAIDTSELKKRFPNLYPSMRKDTLCPIDGGKLKDKTGTSFVHIKNKTAEKGLWTCTSCDYYGNAGCFRGDRKTNERKAQLFSVDSLKRQLEINRAKKQLESELENLFNLGGIDERTYQAMRRAVSGGEFGVLRDSDSGAKEGSSEGSGRVLEENSGVGTGASSDDRGRLSSSGVQFAKDARSTNVSPMQIRNALYERFGEAGIKALEQSGMLKVMRLHDAPESIRTLAERDNASALYTQNGVAYLFSDRMRVEDAPGKLLHELGEHHGLERMLGADGWDRLKKRISTMAKAQGSIAEYAWNGVKKHYKEFDGYTDAALAVNDRFIHEVLAAIGENKSGYKTSLWREILAKIKEWLSSKGLLVEWMNEGDIANLVSGSLKKVMKEARTGLVAPATIQRIASDYFGHIVSVMKASNQLIEDCA